MSQDSRTASAKAGTAAAAAVASTLYEKFLFMEKPTASIEAVVSGKISIFTEEKRARFNRTFIIERSQLVPTVSRTQADLDMTRQAACDITLTDLALIATKLPQFSKSGFATNS